jgi:hypothetical protein
MKKSFSMVLVARAFLHFEWINPIIEKLRSNATDAIAMVNSLMAIFWSVG